MVADPIIVITTRVVIINQLINLILLLPHHCPTHQSIKLLALSPHYLPNDSIKECSNCDLDLLLLTIFD